MRVRIRATGRATYPDVSMVCGPLEYDPEDAAQTAIDGDDVRVVAQLRRLVAHTGFEPVLPP